MSGTGPHDPASTTSGGPPLPAATRDGTVTGSAVRASAWVVGGHAANLVLRFGSNLILARLLFPEVFGLASLVFIFIQGVHQFSDIGTGPAIVQSPRGDDPDFLNTGWTIACIRGVMLWLATCVVAQPLATFYGQPLLAQLLPVAGLNAVIGGCSSTSLHWAQRHLQLKRLTLVELATQVLGIGTNIVLVLVYRSLYPADRLGAVWAFMFGSLLGSLSLTVLSHTVFPGIRNRFHLDRDSAKQLLRFGRWVFLSTMLSFLTGQADRLLLGKMIPLELLGVYGIAANLAVAATQGVQNVGDRVLFPACSRLAGKGQLAQAFHRARLPLLLGGAALTSGFVACGPSLIRILYDNRYEQAGWILQYLAVAAWFQVLDSVNRATLLAQGRLNWMAASNGVKLAALVVLLPLGLRLGGFPGALGALILSDALKYATSAIGAAVGGLRGAGQDLVFTGLIAGVSYAAILGGRTLGAMLQANLGVFVGAALVAGGAWGVAGLWYLVRARAERAARPG